MLHSMHLVNEPVDVGQEVLRIVIVDYIHVHPMAATCKEGLSEIAIGNVLSNGSENHGPWIDRLEISSWHLQY